jgi:hypothetical protein
VKRVGSLVAELNKLCDLFLLQKEEFKQKDKIRRTFTRIIKRGYRITTPSFDPMAPEYAFLSSVGKQDCEQLDYIHKIKIIAIKSQNFEHAADLRDIERMLEKKIHTQFANATDNKYFVILDRRTKLIVYNDYDGKLQEFFRIGKENNREPKQLPNWKKLLILSTHDSKPWQNRIISLGTLLLSRYCGEIKKLL